MRYFRYPGLDKDWSVVTLGCWQIAPSGGWGDLCRPAEAEAVVKSALDEGISAFDTAEGYGDGESERRLGRALGSKKDEVVVISKIWPDADLSLAAYWERLENSLRALGRDYVDLYLVHWPDTCYASRENSAKLCEIMAALKASGKAHLIGLSNFGAVDLRRLGGGIAHFSLNEIPYSLLKREYEDESLEICKAAGIGYMAYSPTAVGLLAGRTTAEDCNFPARRGHQLYQEPNFSRSREVRRTVEAIAQEIERKPIEVAIAWVIEQDNLLTAIVGSRKPWQVSEFVPAGDLILSAEHCSRLTAVSDRFVAAALR